MCFSSLLDEHLQIVQFGISYTGLLRGPPSLYPYWVQFALKVLSCLNLQLLLLLQDIM